MNRRHFLRNGLWVAGAGIFVPRLLTAQNMPMANPAFLTSANSQPSTSSTLNDGLVAYWKLDETSGTRADSETTGTSQNLDDNATVTSNPGVIGNAAQFTAANTEYLSHSDSADLSTGNIDFTIAMWVYLDSKNVDRMFISKESSGQREYRLWYYTAPDRFQFDVSADGTNTSYVRANNLGSPSTGEWYFIVVWHDNGTEIGISVDNGTPNTTSHTTGCMDGTAALWIGRDFLSGIKMDGRIDEVGFWKRVLTSNERTELFNNNVGKTYPF